MGEMKDGNIKSIPFFCIPSPKLLINKTKRRQIELNPKHKLFMKVSSNPYSKKCSPL